MYHILIKQKYTELKCLLRGLILRYPERVEVNTDKGSRVFYTHSQTILDDLCEMYGPS